MFLSHSHLCSVQDLTDECITDILATQQGHHDNHDSISIEDLLLDLPQLQTTEGNFCSRAVGFHVVCLTVSLLNTTTQVTIRGRWSHHGS